MKFPTPLQPATLLRRYKRFLADVRLENGEEITAHVANPGAMTGLKADGARVWLSRSDSKTRKLPYSWELVEVDFGCGTELVSVNTGLTNSIVANGITDGLVSELASYDLLRREVAYGDGHFGTRSRVDFMLQGVGRPDCLVEVKAVSLMRQAGLAEFPDAITTRGTRHLAELAEVAARGQRAVLLFAVQIGSAEAVSVAEDIDPAYASAFRASQAAGVEMLAYTCQASLGGITIARRVPLL